MSSSDSTLSTLIAGKVLAIQAGLKTRSEFMAGVIYCELRRD